MTTREQCPNCRVAVRDAAGALRPSADDVRYDLDGWPVSERILVTPVLVEIDDPYRWDPGVVLSVPARIGVSGITVLGAGARPDSKDVRELLIRA